ncbi:hypothetical protein HU200_010489 [Digitaria exilis]|uniref:Uncharacterized protein n=1 Tax=Digitaria exilis TaxID=1010633 RepID=A0A835KNM7_9POAL|nr:hypothetical protein HU200_010489 [Digitaria exilis]
MHPTFDAASRSLSVTSAEGSSELREQQHQLAHGAASPSPPGGGGVGIIRCHDDRCLLAKADDCAHRPCCSSSGSRGFACPAHVSGSTAAAVAPTRKRPRALHSPATSSSGTYTLLTHFCPVRLGPALVSLSGVCVRAVGQPTTVERFAREVSLEAVVFRRVRLGPHDAEVAYHTTVTIGGHVFRGVLYDVGPARSQRRRSTASTDTSGSSEESSRSTAGGGGGLDLTLRL